MKSFKIGSHIVDDSSDCLIIAELSANHLNDYDLAVKTIHAMKEAGADCVKIQTVRPESITIDCDKPDFVVKGGTLWDGRTLYDLYKEVYTPWEWHEPLKEVARALDMEFFSSPFDVDAVDLLEGIEVPAYKIASFEITDVPLIRYVASKGKPVILSTGVAGEEDIEDAIKACFDEKNEDIILLKCTSSYPTPYEDVHLNMIPEIRKRFNCFVGLSDHTIGSTVALGAIVLGAKVIEKHFILDRKLGGPDAAFSMEPHEFKSMVASIRELEKAMGKPEIRISETMLKSRDFCRSLYVVEGMKKGEKFTNANVRSIRPGFGLKPKYINDVIGKVAKRDIERGTPMSRDLVGDC